MPTLLLHIRTLVIATLGGLVGYIFDLPLGWLVGAMLATAPCAVAGMRMPLSWSLRSVMIGLIGLMVGGSFTPQILERAGEWVFSLAGVAVYCVLITAIGIFMCFRLGRMDKPTAAFSAAPGGLSEILALAPYYNADMRSLSLVHGMRLAIILVIVPVVVTTIGVGAGLGAAAGTAPASRMIDFSLAMPLADFAILAFCLIVGIYGGRRIRLPAAHLTGPLILSAIAHYTGLTSVGPPEIVVVAAQIVIGASVAQFFRNTTAREILRGLAVGGGLTVVNLGLAALFALAFEHYLGIPFAAGLMALVPGGLPEMSLVSIALGLDAAFVSLHHLFRVLLVLMLLPVLVPLWVGRPKAA